MKISSAALVAKAASFVSAADSLVPLVFEPLPLGAVTPTGWLSDQLNLMANGLAGHEHDFYNYVAHSSWTGGSMEYSDLNEGFPYWFNGLVPLAYLTDNPALKEQVHSSASYVLDHQAGDGWLGPENGTARNFWGRMPFFLGLVQLAEANTTWTQPIVKSLHRFNTLAHSMLANNYTGYQYHDGDILGSGDVQWGMVRSQDMMLTLQWLYEKYPGNQAQVLLDNMDFFRNGSYYDWSAYYNKASYIFENLNDAPASVTAANYPYEHGVNVGQGLKAMAVIRRFTHNDSLVSSTMDAVSWTFKYHGAASGTVLADEREVGLSPYSGSELCTAVEAMYSLSYLYQALGTNNYADRTELAAFNALPAMLTPDYWAHQYMAEPNQPYAVNLSATPFYNTNTWGQTFGLEPNYPCCAVNHPQGWPKFASAAFVQSGANGLAHALLSPATVNTKLSSGNVKVACDTTYPFGSTLIYTVTAAKPFDFYVRVPAWYVASTSSVQMGSTSPSKLSPDSATGMHHIAVPAGSSTITYKLGSATVLEPRANDTVAVHRGSLLYALAISSSNTSTTPKTYYSNEEYPADYAPPQSRDYQLMNESAWNVAIDTSTLKFHTGSVSTSLANPLFAPSAPPTYFTAQGCEIDWQLYLDSVPGPAPPKASRKCLGKAYQVRLEPYGALKLHMAELPTISLT